MASRDIYFDPSRFPRAATRAFQQTDSPLPNGATAFFPLQPPTWFPDPPLPVRCHKLWKSTYSTGINHHTVPARSVKALRSKPQARLNLLKYAPGFIDELINYVDAVPNDQTSICTWPSPNGPARLSRANAGDQLTAIRQIWIWLKSHTLMSRNLTINGETAAQDEVREQLLKPLNYLLETRYASTSNTNLHPNENTPGNVSFYPRWRRVVHADGKEGAIAGYPDFILTTDSKRSEETCGAAFEVKTPWNYVSDRILRLFEEIVDDSGRIRWRYGGGILRDLVEQLWGELHFYGRECIIWTNCELVFFAVRTSPGVLTLSKPMKWTSPRLLKAMHGFALASIDCLEDPTLLATLVGQPLDFNDALEALE